MFGDVSAEFVKYALLPRSNRMRQFVIDKQREMRQQAEDAQLAAMRDDIQSAQQRMSETSGGIEALRKKLSEPFAPPPNPMTYGDAAGFGLGLLAGQGGARSAANVKANMDQRGAMNDAVAYQNYQNQQRIDSGTLDDLRGQQIRQGSDLTGLQREYMQQATDLAQTRAGNDASILRAQMQGDSRAGLEQMRQQGRMGLEGVRQQGRIDLEGVRQQGRVDIATLRSTLENEAYQYQQMTNSDGSRMYTDEEIKAHLSAKYKQQIASARLAEERAATERELRSAILADKQMGTKLKAAQVDHLMEQTRFIAPRYQLDYTRTMGMLSLAEEKFAYQQDEVSRRMLVEQYKASRGSLSRLLEKAYGDLSKAKAVFAMNPEDEDAQKAVSDASMTVAELNAKIKAIDSEATKLGRSSSGNVKKNSSVSHRNLAALYQSVQSKFGEFRKEQWNDRSIRGKKNVPSSHKTGDAYDLYGSVDQMKAAANWLAAQPTTTMVIYNRRVWTRGNGWTKYNGVHPHTDHIHLEAKPQ